MIYYTNTRGTMNTEQLLQHALDENMTQAQAEALGLKVWDNTMDYTAESGDGSLRFPKPETSIAGQLYVKWRDVASAE